MMLFDLSCCSEILFNDESRNVAAKPKRSTLWSSVKFPNRPELVAVFPAPLY